MSKIISILLFSTLVTLPSCMVWNGEKKLTLSSIVKQKENLPATLSSVNVANNIITISGSGFADATIVSLKKDGVETPLTIDSKSDSQIVASAISNLGLVLNSSFDLIIGSAEAQATYAITFTLDNNSIDLTKLKTSGASSGYVIKYNGTNWVAAPQNETQIFQGTWDATTNLPDLSVPSSVPGDYFIVSTAGTYNAVTYAVGDWIISDGYSWQKIPLANTSVTSFQGRKGIVTLTPSDYVSLKDTVTNKITGSKLSDLADIDVSTAPLNGQLLKWNTSTLKWVPANDTGGATGISLTDLSATAPLSYSNTTGVFSLPSANILGLPLTGLASGSGAVAATDTILGAFGKLMTVPSDYVSKASGNTLSGATVVSGIGASLTVPTPLITDYGFAANVQFVNDQIAVNGNWSKGASSSINYTAGNVGIGTTSPAYLLNINGANTFISQTGQMQIADSASSMRLNIGVGADASSNKVTWIQSTESSVSNNRNLSLQPFAGNVGIGTTTPSEKLDVAGNIVSITGSIGAGGAPASNVRGIYYAGGTSVVPLILRAASGQLANIFQIQDSTSAGLVTVDPNGKVGIGTSSPSAKLDVQASTSGSTTASQVSISNSSFNKFSILNYDSDYNGFGMSTHFDGTNWIADAVTSSFIYKGSGYLNFFGNSGLTIGNSYSPTSRMSIALATGYVGIGTTAPGYSLDVNGTANFGTSGVMNGDLKVANLLTVGHGTGGAASLIVTSSAHTGASAINISNTGAGGNNWQIFVGGNNVSGGGGTSPNEGNFQIKNVTDNASRLFIAKNTGNVGIGTTSPQTSLQVAGVISPATNNTYTLGNATYRFTEVYATNGVISTSDRREKKDIHNTDLGLDFINKLRPVSYRWNTGVDNDVHYGLIAQEAEEVIAKIGKVNKTSIVTHDEKTDRYGVRYSELISPLIKAVQELFSRLTGIGSDVAILKADNIVKAKEIEKLKQENASIKAYLCGKDKKAVICL